MWSITDSGSDKRDVSSLKEAGYLSTVSDKWSQLPKSNGILKNGKREDVSVPQKQQNHQERERQADSLPQK